MTNSLFILGTDTDVGKTVVSAGLVSLLRRRGIDCGWLKPLGTGAEPTPEGPASPDAIYIRDKTGLTEPYADLCPVLADFPAAPAESLRREGRELDWAGLIDLCRAKLDSGRPYIVEGVGGLMVPLGAGKLLSDLIAKLDLPCLVVARPGLGTINHTLLTLHQLDRLGAEIRGFVFSGSGEAEAVQSNADWISRFHPAPYLGWLPDGTDLAWDKFIARASQALDLDLLWG